MLRRSALTGFAGDASGCMGGLGGFEWRRTNAAALEPAERRVKKSSHRFYGGIAGQPAAECPRAGASAIQFFAAQPNQKLHPRRLYRDEATAYLMKKKAPRRQLRGAPME